VSRLFCDLFVQKTFSLAFLLFKASPNQQVRQSNKSERLKTFANIVCPFAQIVQSAACGKM
jgi:hypothetical protein